MKKFDLQEWLVSKGFYNNMSDEKFIKMRFKHNFGYEPDLDNPKTFNEKLQWLKLYNRQPIFSTMVDKYGAKEYVANIIGAEHIVPTLGVWDSFEEIDFPSLPNQFVLKCTHDSGGLVICKDKSKLDIDEAKQKIQKSLKENYYLHGREWPYKNVKPRIIAEKYLEDESGNGLKDYKFFCFDGEPKFMFIATGRAEGKTCFDFFDLDFNHIPVKQHYPNAAVLPKKPKRFEEMKELAAKLSKNLKHVRVDFFEVDDKIYFGELTFMHFGGLEKFEPNSYDYKFGEYLNLDI